MTGLNMSSELKDSSRSIPNGTIAAHATTTGFYILLIFLFGSVGDRSLLVNENVIIAAEVAWPLKMFVNVGIIIASLGTALQTIAGTPVILHTLA